MPKNAARKSPNQPTLCPNLLPFKSKKSIQWRRWLGMLGQAAVGGLGSCRPGVPPGCSWLVLALAVCAAKLVASVHTCTLPSLCLKSRPDIAQKCVHDDGNDGSGDPGVNDSGHGLEMEMEDDT